MLAYSLTILKLLRESLCVEAQNLGIRIRPPKGLRQCGSWIRGTKSVPWMDAGKQTKAFANTQQDPASVEFLLAQLTSKKITAWHTTIDKLPGLQCSQLINWVCGHLLPVGKVRWNESVVETTTFYEVCKTSANPPCWGHVHSLEHAWSVTLELQAGKGLFSPSFHHNLLCQVGDNHGSHKVVNL